MKKNRISIFLLIMLCLTLIGSGIISEAAEYKAPDEITGMDLDGNVYVIEDETGLMDETVSLYAKTEGPKIVNLNTKGSEITKYIEEGTNIEGYTCGAYGADAAFLGFTDDNKVKFMLAGVIGIVDESEVQVIDFDKAVSVSHYVVKNGRLIHYVTTNMNKDSYGSSLDQGAAPSYMSEGKKYYSYDGFYFYTDYGVMIKDYAANTRNSAINKDAPFINYFQFVPLRTKTSFTTDELTQMINSKSGEDSLMYNLGSSFINNQNKYGVNALLASGIAANESAWGKSKIAREKNNLFGLNAVDSSPGESANYYPSADACIKEFAQYHMSKGYLYPKDWRYFGGSLGNKASGINVKYASDPYWGEKAANIAWMFSKQNSTKDVNAYTIGMKDIQSHDHTGVNVRNKATVDGSSVLFTTPKASAYPVVILGEENGFYKIQSDAVLNSDRTAIEKAEGEYDYSNMYAYISKDYVEKVISGKDNQVPDPKPEPQPVPKPDLKEGWNEVEGKWYYVEKGEMVKGWKQFGSNWCYFGKDGAAYTGLQKIDGKYYFFGTDCYMRTGWREIEGKWYYFKTDGDAAIGWRQFDSNWCYFGKDGAAYTGLQKIDGEYYYFDNNCYMQTGWQEVDGNRYYFDSEGKGVRGLYKEHGRLYYFDEQCRMQTGWQEIDGNKYYFDEDGVAVSGLKDMDGDLYCFDENCIMYTGWYNLDDGKCYFDTDGKAVRGLKKIENNLYFFNDKYIMQTGWQEVGGNRYYFYVDGKAAKGLVKIEGSLYYFDEECHMHIGWKYLNKNWYYFNQDGKAVKGWAEVDKEWYYFNENCEMIRGWKYIDGYWYYFKSYGAAAKGWAEIDGEWYYFNQNCVMIRGWKYIDGYWYYFKSYGAAAKGWRSIDGEWYYFNQSCVMVKGWREIDGYWYYFYSSGAMAKDTWIDGCYVNSSGVWVK